MAMGCQLVQAAFLCLLLACVYSLSYHRWVNNVRSYDDIQVMIQQNGTAIGVQVVQQHLNRIRSSPPYFTVAEPMSVHSQKYQDGAMDADNLSPVPTIMEDDSMDRPTKQIKAASTSSHAPFTSVPTQRVDSSESGAIANRSTSGLHPSSPKEADEDYVGTPRSTFQPTPQRDDTYQRHNIDTTPRTDYNDILKNIRFKMPALLPKEFSFIQPFKRIFFEGSKRIEKPAQEAQPFLSHDTPPDVTIITQSSSSRLFYIPHLLQRWKGSISLALLVTEDEQANVLSAIQGSSYPNRLRITVYLHNPRMNECVFKRGRKNKLKCIHTSIFPINRLRNMAIANVVTTHFVVFDMDMWPAFDTYDTLVSLPSSYLRNDYFVTIIPAFSFYDSFLKQIPCDDFEHCAKRAFPLLPRTKSDLFQCVKAANCSLFRPQTRTHNYISDSWLHLDTKTPLVYLKCFRERFMEPYVMVRRSSLLPSFDERFINYGFNKVQWIENLRYLGFEFYVLGQSFAFDIPHEPSNFAKTYIERFMNHPDMLHLYRYFLMNLRRSPDQSRQLLCLSKCCGVDLSSVLVSRVTTYRK